MMFETLILLAAAATPAPAAPEMTSRAAKPAIIEMTYNAFVAVEETPELSEIVHSAVEATPDIKRAIDFPTGTAWIS
jgi:hypothetical protein